MEILFKNLSKIKTIKEEDLKDQQGFYLITKDVQRTPIKSKLKKCFIDDSTIKGKMLKEIENYIENNMCKMHEEIKEIELRYEDELLQLMGLDDTYCNIIQTLKEEMKVEIYFLKLDYEVISSI
jgi:hypothetical protein